MNGTSGASVACSVSTARAESSCRRLRSRHSASMCSVVIQRRVVRLQVCAQIDQGLKRAAVVPGPEPSPSSPSGGATT
jgi:hypothetical protein